MRKSFFIFFIFTVQLIANPGSSYNYGYSARSFALSSAMVADKNDTFKSFANPALLSQCNDISYGLSYFMMSQDRSIQTFYFSKKLPGNAGVSGGILRTSIGEFMGKDSFNNPTEELSSSDYYGLLSFGLGSSKGNGIGLSMRMHYSNLHVNELHINKHTGTSITVDLGITYSITSKYQLGLKLQNFLNPNINWDINRGDGMSRTYDEQYPLIVMIGSRIDVTNNSKLVIQKDFYLLDYDSEVYNQFFRFGYEHIIWNNFALRMGLQDENKYRFGFGYRFDINTFPLVLDYAVDLGSENEGISHLFTWSFNL